MKPALWFGLALACGGALAVSWLPEDEVAAPVVRHGATSDLNPPSVFATAAEPSLAGPVAQRPLLRDAWPALAGSARAAWYPPVKPVPPTPPPPPPPPPAPPPPFPYQWLGQMEEGARLRFFLASPQQTVAVAAGEVLDQRWRVEGLDGGALRLTWLPTGATVRVVSRGASPSKPDPA